jgi:hypothetical protein
MTASTPRPARRRWCPRAAGRGVGPLGRRPGAPGSGCAGSMFAPAGSRPAPVAASPRAPARAGRRAGSGALGPLGLGDLADARSPTIPATVLRRSADRDEPAARLDPPLQRAVRSVKHVARAVGHDDHVVRRAGRAARGRRRQRVERQAQVLLEEEPVRAEGGRRDAVAAQSCRPAAAWTGTALSLPRSMPSWLRPVRPAGVAAEPGLPRPAAAARGCPGSGWNQVPAGQRRPSIVVGG